MDQFLIEGHERLSHELQALATAHNIPLTLLGRWAQDALNAGEDVSKHVNTLAVAYQHRGAH